jgi:hypothetical protein
LQDAAFAMKGSIVPARTIYNESAHEARDFLTFMVATFRGDR